MHLGHPSRGTNHSPTSDGNHGCMTNSNPPNCLAGLLAEGLLMPAKGSISHSIHRSSIQCYLKDQNGTGMCAGDWARTPAWAEWETQ